MSDNISLNAGSGGAMLKTDQLADLSHVQYVKLMDGTADGTGVIAIGGGLEAGALRVTLASDSTGVITVDNAGTFAVQAAQTGTWTVQPGNTANTTAWLVTGTGGTFPVTGTFWQATQPISAASLPLPTGAATDATMATIAGYIDTEIASLVALMAGGMPAALGAGGGLKVDGSGTALPVSGTVTANAGTNLNTSALAIETGGNLASAVTALQIIDDWDATDDCRSVVQTASVMDGATKCTVKRFMLATATDGATLIAAVASKKFRIFSLSVIATSTTATNFWLEDADGADVYGDSTGIPVDADGGSGPAGLVLGHNPDGWFQTATANKNLVIKLTVAQKVVVAGTYTEVD